MEQALLEHLPQDIVLHILLRLPFKSLQRFRSLRKLWFALITSHDFILAHHERASNDIDHVRCAQLGSSDQSFFLSLHHGL